MAMVGPVKICKNSRLMHYSCISLLTLHLDFLSAAQNAFLCPVWVWLCPFRQPGRKGIHGIALELVSAVRKVDRCLGGIRAFVIFSA